MSQARTDGLAIVPDEEIDDDTAEAEQQLLAAFANVRSAEKTNAACVEIPRYANVPRRTADGKLVMIDGKTVLGSMELYFQRLQPGTLAQMRKDHTVKEPVRRRGRVEYDEKLDDDSLGLDAAYTAMLPWCRSLYFDNPKLWANEPVGTGQEFLRLRLNLGELSYCLDAVMQLEGLGDEHAEQLGKH